jgi:hypothetical protein
VEQLEHRWCPSFGLVTSRAALAATDSVNWATLGPPGTHVANPFTVLSTAGRSISVSKPISDNFLVSTNVLNLDPGESVLWSNDTFLNSPNPITLNFGATAVAAGGAQIEPWQGPGKYTATVEAFDAAGKSLAKFNEQGAFNGVPNSAIFIGISSSSADISQIALSITKGQNKSSFYIDKFDFRTGALAAAPVAVPRALSAATSASTGDSLYIGDGNDNTVKQFDATTGALLGTFVASGSGGLDGPRGLIFGEGHNLLAVNQNVFTTLGGEVLRYDGQTGAFISKVVADTDPHNPYDPCGVVRGPHHSLFVGDLGDLGNLDGTGRPGRLAQFDEKTGAWIRDLSTSVPFTTDNGPRGVVIGPDGDLYVAVRNFSPLGGEVMRFDPVSGAFLGDFVDSNSTNDLNRPEGLVFGPDGNLYVTSFRANAGDNDKILEFNGATGAYLGKIDLDAVGGDRAFAQALLFGPGGKLFVPITGGGPDTGEVRRYDVSTGNFDVFVPPNALGGPLGMPWYLTFGNTDPVTLAYSPNSHTVGSASPAAAAAVTRVAQPAGLAALLVPSSQVLTALAPATTAVPPPVSVAPSGTATSEGGAPQAPSRSSAAPAGATDAVFAASSPAANDDGAWLFASFSSSGLVVI